MFGSFWSVIAFTRANKGIVWNTSEETNCWPDQDWLRSISERLGTTVQECLRLPRHAMKRPQGCGLSKGSSSTSPSSGSCRACEIIRHNMKQWETWQTRQAEAHSSPVIWGFPVSIHCRVGSSVVTCGDTKWYKMCAWSWMAARSFGSKAVAGVAEVGELSASCAGGASSTLSCRRGFTDGFCTKSGK